MSKLVKLVDVHEALRLIVAEHNAIESDAWLSDGTSATKCWGWGTLQHMTERDPCVDCGLPDGDLVHASGAVLCWRCAFWRHMAWCPHGDQLAGTVSTAA